MTNLKQMLAEPESKSYRDELNSKGGINNLPLHIEGEGYRETYRSFRKAGLKTDACKPWFSIWIQVDRYFSEAGIDDIALSSRFSKLRREARTFAYQIADNHPFTPEEQINQNKLEHEYKELLDTIVPLYVFLRRQGFTREQITS